MKKILIITFLLLTANSLFSQCLEGDCKDGYGKFQYTESTFEGNFKNALRNGEGTMIWDNGQKYTGNWVDDFRSGYGVYSWGGGMKYEGYWQKNLRHGNGTMIYSDGAIYDGQWFDNKREGIGTLIWANGQKYIGEWSQDLIHGVGKEYNPKGELEFLGQYKNGKRFKQMKEEEFFVFSSESFCNELLSLISLSKTERESLKVSYFNKDFKLILEKKFLNHFEVIQTILENEENITQINFPDQKEGIPTVSLKQLLEGLTFCEKVKATENNLEFYFDNKKIIIREGDYGVFSKQLQYELIINYPKGE